MLKKFFTFFFLLTASSMLFAQDASVDNATNVGGQVLVQYPTNWQFQYPQAVLFTSGPHYNVPNGGAGGAHLSSLQSSLGMTSFGWAHQSGFRVADDFIIPAGQTWTIDNVELYAYQTGSTTTSTITGVNIRIWSGAPGTGTIVFGDTTTNRMASTAFANVYRASETTPTNTQRPLMRQVVNIGITLPAGTYWLDWQTTGTLASGPWVPPIVITGNATTGNAKQFNSSTGQWSDITDGGSLTPQGLPFTINGTAGTMSAGKSVKIVGNDDIVKTFATSPYSSGNYRIRFYVYIPSGKAGYFNTLAVFAGNNSNWGLEVFFDANGTGRCFGGSATATTFTWLPNRWNLVEHFVNLTTNQSQFVFNGNVIRTWQWTLGANGVAIPNQLHATNLYGATANDEMYVDDYSVFNLTTNQMIYQTGFEEYVVGQLIACQAPTVWLTWSNQPCGPEDAEISSTYYIPVELTSFTATVNPTNVELNWTTATELNNYGFEIERRTADGEYYTIGFVKGNGTTTQVNRYSYIDKNLEPGKYFYRLKQLDYSGAYEYSNEIEVDFNLITGFNLEQNYPNPFNPVTKIRFSILEKSQVKLAVYNLIGEVVATLVNKPMDMGTYEVEFDGSGLPSGMYIYKLEAGGNSIAKKMMIMK
ncbi:MAG: T9SS type A sorting domain-containing protein [Ignavibacterium sp.]|nr:T9SS type A sorting domain-containing protein [Ignavibacterium sp.]